jgi:hypothetical protein
MLFLFRSNYDILIESQDLVVHGNLDIEIHLESFLSKDSQSFDLHLFSTLQKPVFELLEIYPYFPPCYPSAYAARNSKSITQDFKSTLILSIPELPNWIVGGTRALGRIKRQVVPPFAGMDTLSHIRMLFIVGVGT